MLGSGSRGRDLMAKLSKFRCSRVRRPDGGAVGWVKLHFTFGARVRVRVKGRGPGHGAGVTVGVGVRVGVRVKDVLEHLVFVVQPVHKDDVKLLSFQVGGSGLGLALGLGRMGSRMG